MATSITGDNMQNIETAHAPRKKVWYKNLTVQVLIAIAIGVLDGELVRHLYADDPARIKSIAEGFKMIGDGFINMIKMIIGPIIFLTIVTGISGMGDMKKVGRVGGKAILYFEIVTTVALALGLLVVNVTQPGAGLDMGSLAQGDVSKYAKAGAQKSTADFFFHIIPHNIVGAFAEGELLQILFVSILFGIALQKMGETGKPVEQFLGKLTGVFFGIIEIVMIFAPIGAFGAMAYTVTMYGIETLVPLARLMIDVIGTMAFFVFFVLGAIARYYRISILKLLRYIRQELFIVLGTSSSESVLPRMMEKLEHMGCSRSVVGLVIPTGYSFNLDGTSIYLSMAAIFIAQAYGIPLSIGEQLAILGVLMVTSKGAAGVTGSGFIVLAATLAATGKLPVEGMGLLLGVDRFMSTARALTNLIGNVLATVVIAKMEKEFDETQAVEAYRESFEDPSLQRI